MLSVEIRGMKALARAVSSFQKQERKALNVAVRVEGFRLMKRLKRELRQGRPGGRPFSKLRRISGYYEGKRLQEEIAPGAKKVYRRNRKALVRAATAVRYFIPKKKETEMHVGWTGPAVSKSWKRIMKLQQEGFSAPVTDEIRREFVRRGAAMAKRSLNRRYFFLRKTTTRFRTPARPVIDPFWRAHREEAWRNIRNNYRRKLSGERI